MDQNVEKLRNIGISAHIDSGKTTLTERMLFYTQKIHAIHEVHGKDGVGAAMDSMELEKERGITIVSSATNIDWKGHSINIIDTPGHVDFTIEVERALRVLDGAILVLCSVGGVQSQSIAVDRQLKRYKIPCIAFINKCDRVGANPYKVISHLEEKLGHNPVIIQLPIGLEDKMEGVVDLVTMKAIYFDGPSGENVRIEKIPENLKDDINAKHEEMINALSLICDDLAEAFLEGNETEKQIKYALRKGTLNREITPVMTGAAYKNIGVQPLMDAVINYLPAPSDIENTALDLADKEKKVILASDSKAPIVALAFKLEESPYGQLTYIRIYQGIIKKGDELYNVRMNKSFKVGRLIRMHADNMEDIKEAKNGDIVALFGINCASGDTFCSKELNYSMMSMHVPEPVISLAVTPKEKKTADNIAKALNRFKKEDPTFQYYVDPELNQTIISGMGELHLDVYIERIKREYKAEVEVGMPQVAYRETITKTVEFDYTHKKQTGGAGQYGRVCGTMSPDHENDYTFVDKIKGGVIPTEYIQACDKGFQDCLSKGSLIGFPVVGIKMIINDGNFHPVDSSEKAFIAAAIGAFRQAFNKAGGKILEPVMKVSVEGPSEFQGNVLSTINQRRGIIISTSENNLFCSVEAEVPLSEMFGYSTVLRSQTQGKSEFSMEFRKYATVPLSKEEELIKEYHEKDKK